MAIAKTAEQDTLLQDAGEQQPEQQPESVEIVKVRVLGGSIYGKVNEVVEVPAAVAAATPELDADPAAVAYAESLKYYGEA